MNKDNKKVQLTIKGAYRTAIYAFFARRKARQLGLKTHSIRVLESGHIELVHEGNTTALWEIIHWSKSGPVFCLVDEVVVQFSDSTAA